MRRRKLLASSCIALFAFGVIDSLAYAQGTPPPMDRLYSPSTGDDSATARELAMTDGPDEPVFLRAIADRTKVVIGEQVTVSVYLYHRVAYEMSERHDAKYSDFLRYSLLTDPGSTIPIYTHVKDQRYGARLVDKVALIPLKSGKLATGSMTARFKGRQIGARVLKASNDLTIEVTEPPLAGRPKNYQLGDVGRFIVSATVQPRKTTQGGSIGVIIKIDGTGNAPSKLTPPAIPGAKWLEPRVRDSISGKTGRVGGARHFEYVLRLGNAGPTELGKLEVPYYDPEKQAYVVAEVELGTVQVEESFVIEPEVDLARGKSDPTADPLTNMPPARTVLSAFTKEKTTPLPLSWFALGVFLPPLFALALLGGRRANAARKVRKSAVAVTLKQQVKEGLNDARKADKAADARALSLGIERAIHAAIELQTGVKSRALRLGELAELSLVGIDPEVIQEVEAMLSECEALRFAPSVGEDARTGLLSRAAALTKKLSP